MKRRALLGELGISPGNLMHAHGHIRSTKRIDAGDLMTNVAIGGNGRCVKLLVLLVRSGQAVITFNADAFSAVAFSRVA